VLAAALGDPAEHSRRACDHEIAWRAGGERLGLLRGLARAFFYLVADGLWDFEQIPFAKPAITASAP